MRISDWSSDVCSSDLNSHWHSGTDRAFHAFRCHGDSIAAWVVRLRKRLVMPVLDRNAETFCQYFHLQNPFFFFYRSEPLGFGLACLRHKNTGVSFPGISCSLSLNNALRISLEERRVGDGCVSTFRFRWCRYH